MKEKKKIKKPAHRPLKFASPKHLQDAVDKYFQECRDNTKPFVTKEGKVVEVPSPKIPTIAGLASRLKVDRQTIYNYEAKEMFFDIIKNARTYILGLYEDRCANEVGNLGGLIFLMKNYGYADNLNISTGLNDSQVSALVNEANKIMQNNV